MASVYSVAKLSFVLLTQLSYLCFGASDAERRNCP